MAQYEKIFEKPYEDGYEDLPSQNTPITAKTLNDKDAAIVNIENYLEENDIPSDASDLSYNNTSSTLIANTVQSAIDELSKNKANADNLAYVNVAEGLVVPDLAYKAGGYAAGEHFMHKGKFCTAIASIASGATLTLNTNYVEGNISDYLSVKEYTASINANASSYATMHTNTVRRSGNHVSVQIRFNITNMPANANQNILNLPFKLSGGVKFGQLNSNTVPFKLLDVGMYLISNGNVVQLNDQLSNGDYYFSIDYLTNDPL